MIPRYMKSVVIMQGAPGSGKSAMANLLESIGATVVSADDFFDDGVEYKFHVEKLKDAHDHCFAQFQRAISNDDSMIVVDNTNTRQWEAQRYIDAARGHGYTVYFCRATGEFENIHDVPKDKVLVMRERMEELR